MTPSSNITTYKLWERIIYFFPVQLLFVHLKKNLLLLLFWLLLFALVTGSVSLKYGVPYLFLFPEYLGSVGFLSHLIVGLTAGAFIMSFNISSYVVNGFRFPFLATLNRPFLKYCQNNVVLPLAFSVTYMVFLFKFQLNNEQLEFSEAFVNASAYILGNALFVLLTIGYFIATNKNLFHFIPKLPEKKSDEYINPVSDLFSPSKKWERNANHQRKEWKVVTYISRLGKIRIARDSSHYKKETLEKVFTQNRINASLFQVLNILAILFLGYFNQYEWLQIPAAASILLFCTMLIMLISSVYSWLKGWTSIVLLTAIVALNFLSTKSDFIYRNQAYGLDYNAPRRAYTQAQISEHQTDQYQIKMDFEHGLEMLENWKRKTGEEKPLAIFINVPGGGLRSAIWSMTSLALADSVTKGKTWKNTILLSGSSGGMLGAAYLREYQWRKQSDTLGLRVEQVINEMANDKLNAVAATAVLNDAFFRFKRFEFNDQLYTKDRATSFEAALNRDTRGWLDRPISTYHDLEYEAKMPMLLMAPTISDDGRKLLISSQPIAYLCEKSGGEKLNENIEFGRFFEAQGAENLRFLSALRMSATFPYVFPAANLPTTPDIEILDAGIRDNSGMVNTLKFIHTFRDWLAQNTSKVLILQVRDQEKTRELSESKRPSILEGITQPFGTFYKTILVVQDYIIDDQIELIPDWYDGEVELIDLVLDRSETNPISLSWHLTAREKERISKAQFSDRNKAALARLRKTVLEK
ncbi:MAG: hypothetical protein Salg2KO_13810 [Salibacteraceae bacterium]